MPRRKRLVPHVMRVKRLGELFPAYLPIANVIFRLAVAKEDLRIEFHGIGVSRLPRFDRNDEVGRRTYFFRRSCQTLTEVGRILSSAPVRRYRASSTANANVVKKLEAVGDALRHAFKQLEFVRNKASSHLDFEAFQRLLEDQADYRGEIEWGRRSADGTFFKLVRQVTFYAMLKNPPKTQEKFDGRVKGLITQASKAMFGVWAAIDDLVATFVISIGAWQ